MIAKQIGCEPRPVRAGVYSELRIDLHAECRVYRCCALNRIESKFGLPRLTREPRVATLRFENIHVEFVED